MNDVVCRLAAANPVPTGGRLQELPELRWRPQRAALAIALAAAIALPAVAFAGRLGDLFGISNQGSPEPTSSLALSQDSTMSEGMASLGFPSTMQQLGTVNGVSFFASRRADGHYCFAIENDGDRGGISCDLDGRFPSPATPVWAFPPHDRLAGFAADGVAAVRGLDASGDVVVTAPVAGNLFASPAGDYTTVATVEALDPQGDRIWSWRLPDR